MSNEERENAQTTSDRQEDEAKQKVKGLEENPPEKLEDWPDDQAKYETYGGPEGEHSYEEGPEAKLGPSSLRHREDGGVEVAGDAVDDPSEFKAAPIPGGPTDPEASNAPGSPDLSEVGHTGEDYEEGKPVDKSGSSEPAEEKS